MRTINYQFRTICEVLREINDLHQTDSDADKQTRQKLIEAEGMAKRMSKKLFKDNKKLYKKFWKSTPGKKWEKILTKRLNTSYLAG